MVERKRRIPAEPLAIMTARRRSKAGNPAAEQALYFRPSARLQRYLGEELISDPNLAILEFVKNAYDAGAASAVIRFNLMDEPDSLLIADDGVGMDLAGFRYNWMRPGFSEKSSRSTDPQVEAG